MGLGMGDVSEESCKNILTKKKESIMIVIGGAHESLDAHKREYKLTLKKRKGFCRIALETGSHLVPVFAFGENALFDQVDNPEGSTLRKIQTWMQNTLGFTLPLFHGRGICLYDYGILPRRQELNTVVGEPIKVEKIEKPSKEQINDLNEKYAAALVKLYEDNAAKFNEKAPLTIAN